MLLAISFSDFSFSIYTGSFSSSSKEDIFLFHGDFQIFLHSFTATLEYDRVFPMNILPEFLIKATIAFDVEKMENLGIYEVAPEDFALCEFVCSSKMELQRIVREGLDMLRREMC